MDYAKKYLEIKSKNNPYTNLKSFNHKKTSKHPYPVRVFVLIWGIAMRSSAPIFGMSCQLNYIQNKHLIWQAQFVLISSYMGLAIVIAIKDGLPLSRALVLNANIDNAMIFSFTTQLVYKPPFYSKRKPPTSSERFALAEYNLTLTNH